MADIDNHLYQMLLVHEDKQRHGDYHYGSRKQPQYLSEKKFFPSYAIIFCYLRLKFIDGATSEVCESNLVEKSCTTEINPNFILGCN